MGEGVEDVGLETVCTEGKDDVTYEIVYDREVMEKIKIDNSQYFKMHAFYKGPPPTVNGTQIFL